MCSEDRRWDVREVKLMHDVVDNHDLLIAVTDSYFPSGMSDYSEMWNYVKVNNLRRFLSPYLIEAMILLRQEQICDQDLQALLDGELRGNWS
jgi:hypothetical protein